ncbi:hypothetical protein NBRC116494_29480 [Aurantivibrio plasticivorans]
MRMIGNIAPLASTPNTPITPPAADKPAVPAPIEPTTSAVPDTTEKVSPTVITQNSEEPKRNQGDIDIFNLTAEGNPTYENPAKTRQPSDASNSLADEQGTAEKQNTSNQAAEKQENSPQQLTPDELKVVEQLRARDREVRTHEAAHLAAAGQYATGGIKLETTRGPDGLSYAIGGSVGIDTSRESTPEATLRKAEQIQRAALAPAEPSGQDRRVAAEASAMKLEAQVEIRQQRAEQAAESNEAAAPQSTSDNTSPSNSAIPPGDASGNSSGSSDIGPANDAIVASPAQPPSPGLERYAQIQSSQSEAPGQRLNVSA